MKVNISIYKLTVIFEDSVFRKVVMNAVKNINNQTGHVI